MIKFKKGEKIIYFKYYNNDRNNYKFEEAKIIDIHTDDLISGIYYTIQLVKFNSYKELQTTEDKLLKSKDLRNKYKQKYITKDEYDKYYLYLNFDKINRSST